MTTQVKVLNGFDVCLFQEIGSGYFPSVKEAKKRARELGANILVRGGKEGSKYYFKYVENKDILIAELNKYPNRNIKNHKLWILDSKLFITITLHTIKDE